MISRRNFLYQAASAAALTNAPRALWAGQPAGRPRRGPSHHQISLDPAWQFSAQGADAAAAQSITLPHCVAPLSWQGWDPATWERLWSYRRAFDSPLSRNSHQRVFLHFDGVLSGAAPTLNGTALGPNLGGFLPFEQEITDLLREKNQLSVAVDGRWLNAPPEGSPKGPVQIDYMVPAGIHRSVSLRLVPETFIADVFAKPVDVLQTNRRLLVACTLDSRAASPTQLRLEATLFDGNTRVAHETTAVGIEQQGTTEAQIVLEHLGNIQLWSPETPKLYTVHVALRGPTGIVHEYITRVGFREARFEVGGFFLNGKHSRIFGLNRHELFPYVGFAMPDRVKRRDAEMLRREFNCNTVRCSHYPQSGAFLDACDELGLMVWEEVPGWQYIGDQPWQQLLLRDVRRMVLRDRNRPSVIVWGVRINESPNNVELYTQTRQLAKSLDDSRQTSGTMTHYSTANWVQDVFAYDDYHARPDGSVAMRDPLPGVPFFFSEGVGQYQYMHGKGFKQYYRRAGNPITFREQALFHAQGHDRAARDPRCGGFIAWCVFDYASLLNGYNMLKCPGIVDTFRIPKLGASFYRAQVSPADRPVIEPSFFWDFTPVPNNEPGAAQAAPETTQPGPGKAALIFSNCDRLVLHIGTHDPVTVTPDKAGYPNLPYPPFFADLTPDSSEHPDLRIDGYVGDRLVLTRRFSSDRSQDTLILRADDPEIAGDGSDATRVWFSVCDKYGAPCPCLEGEVTLHVEGPGERIGDATLSFAETGGVGAIWVRSKPHSSGRITVRASHPRFGTKSVTVEVSATDRI